MTEGAHLLAALQHGDSFFPGGATAFSWGLETLAGEDRIATAEDVRAYVEAQLCGRWATFDRAATIAAYRAAGDLDQVAAIDRLVDAQTLAHELREASRRIGGALLTVHRRLGTPGAEAYAAREDAPGHGTAVQGMLWHGAGVSEPAADAMAAHQLCIGLLGAALRLGLIGHVDGWSRRCWRPSRPRSTTWAPLCRRRRSPPCATKSKIHDCSAIRGGRK
jgi:urease accessory protein